MIRDWQRWHRLTAEFAAAQLAETLPERDECRIADGSDLDG